MYAILQRHTVSSDFANHIDAVYFSRAISDAWNRLAPPLVALDAIYADIGIEFVNMLVAFVIFRRRIEDRIRTRIYRALIDIGRLIVFGRGEARIDMLVIGLVFNGA